MDPYSLYVEDLPADVTFCDIKDTFCVFQRSPPPTIVKKEKYLISTFMKPKTVQKILRRRDTLNLKGQNVTVKEAFVQFRPRNIHLPPSFFLPINVLPTNKERENLRKTSSQTRVRQEMLFHQLGRLIQLGLSLTWSINRQEIREVIHLNTISFSSCNFLV